MKRALLELRLKIDNVAGCRFNHNNQQTGCQKYSSKNCNGVTFQEMDYDTFREIIPVLHNSSKDENKHEQADVNGSLGHAYYLKWFVL